MSAEVQEIINNLSLVAGLTWAVVAFARGWVVPASVHSRMVADRDDWKTRHDKIASIAEMVLRAKVGGGA